MKKILLSVSLCLASFFYFTPPTYAWEPVPLVFGSPRIKPEKDRPRNPIEAPLVGQEGYTLYFFDEEDFTVNLYSVDGDDNLQLEYTAMVASSSSTLVLPTTLTGIFTIEVIRDGQHFWGEIEL